MRNKARELFRYDPKTGTLTHRIQRGRWRAGMPAGTIRTRVYATVHYQGRDISMAKFLHYYMTGKWPKGVVDHKNGDATDFRWKNLRDATYAQNAANARPRPNVQGYTGITKQDGKFRAKIQANGWSYYLGRFDTRREAHRAYLAAKAHLHGEWSRSNRKATAKLPSFVSRRKARTRTDRSGRSTS